MLLFPPNIRADILMTIDDIIIPITTTIIISIKYFIVVDIPLIGIKLSIVVVVVVVVAAADVVVVVVPQLLSKFSLSISQLLDDEFTLTSLTHNVKLGHDGFFCVEKIYAEFDPAHDLMKQRGLAMIC